MMIIYKRIEKKRQEYIKKEEGESEDEKRRGFPVKKVGEAKIKI